MFYPRNYPTSIPDVDYHLASGIPIDVLDKYFTTVIAHITAVQEAGHRIGVQSWQLQEHDVSKFSREEFGGYALHFHGGGAPNEFAYAWLHHIHFNPHHWQYWMFPDNFTPKGSLVVENGVMEMPPNYALEMVADWMGASAVYSGTDDMSDWLSKNMSRITLHTNTARYVRDVLSNGILDYGDIVHSERWKHELRHANAAED